MINPNQSQPENLLSSPKSAERKKFTTKQKVGLLMAGISVFGALGTGCSAKSPDVNTPTTSEAPATPSEQATSTEPAEKSVESYAKEMEKYKSMDIDSFEAIPRDEKLVYAQFLIDQTIDRGTYDFLYGVGTRSESACAITPTEATPQDDGQQILDNNLFNLQIAYAQFIEADSSSKAYDKEDGQKLLSAAYYEAGTDNTVSNDYVATKEQLKSLSKPVSMSNINTAIDTSELMSGKTRDGEVVEYKYVTYKENVSENTIYARYIYREFVSYDGTKKSVWLFDDASTKSIEDLKF